MKTGWNRNLFLLLLVCQVSSRATLRSGTGDAPDPPYQPDTAIRIDFSLMDDSCSSKIIRQCPCTENDLWIKGDSIRSAYGIEADSVLGALAIQRAMPISNPSAVGPVFDSLFDSLCVVAPVKGWTKSVHLQPGAFYIKTSEGGYGLLVIFGQYVGGIDRYYYYWAYQEDGMRWLYKGIGPVSGRDSVFVEPFCFSGRQDPIFGLRDSADLTLLHRTIDSLTNLAAAIGIAKPGYPSWGGIGVSYNMPALYPPVEGMHDSVAVLFSQGNARSFPDPGGMFEALLVSLLRKEDPVSIIGTDTVEAVPLLRMLGQIPDAALPRSVGNTVINGMQGSIRYLRPQRAVEVRLDRPRHVSVVVFDCLGKRQAVVFDGVLAAGTRCFSLSTYSGGVSLVRILVENAESVFVDLPLR
jgi:hypothetical protein